MLSQKARYALRAMLCLARENKPLPIRKIAEVERIPRKFLELILLDLKSHGLVLSHRGKTGGYELAKPPDAISFADVLRVIDGPLALAPCASRTAFRRCKDCPSLETCAIRAALLEVRAASAAILESRTLAAANAAIEPMPA
jgi:Rrf2 family protein